MNSDVETFVRQGIPWQKLPTTIKQLLGNTEKEYNKCIIQFSIKNQLRFRGNLVRSVKKNEMSYYEELLRYSREHLMLYPYHLSDFIVTGMRITPFQYYISIMQDLLEQERSYDSLPNFTAADCLRLLGIGRNQYIELMNQSRSSKKFFGVRKKPVRDFLPMKPVANVPIEPWWKVQVGYVTEDDIKLVTESEKVVIDKIIDDGSQVAGTLHMKDIRGLYLKGLVYLDVPVNEEDCFIVPPLEGFVMNRVLGDYFENLLYQIFVSIDEHTNISELAHVLQTDSQLVKNVVSMYCRLGFALKKGVDVNNGFHSSWLSTAPTRTVKTEMKEMEAFVMLLNTDAEGEIVDCGAETMSLKSPDEPVSDLLSSVSSTSHSKRIGFLFDSTLTAFLMMGNLSPGLKSHAVTMFEVGKLSDESLDSFLIELEKVGDIGEGEAQRYFHHALTLRSTILFLRNNPNMLCTDSNDSSFCPGLALDLIRCESLLSLQAETCSRLLNKNYSLLVSMAPLTNEIRPVTSCKPPHLGPANPEVNSVWFKLFTYSVTKFGPPTLLLVKGTRLRVLPKVFRNHKKLLVTTWNHDPGQVPTSNAIITLNDALCHSAVLIQGQGSGGDLSYVPFPLDNDDNSNPLKNHEAIQTLAKNIDLKYSCGYVTMIRSKLPISNASDVSVASSVAQTPLTPNLPLNGITDDASRQLLASELDQLDDQTKNDQLEGKRLKNKPHNLVLQHSASVSNFYNHENWTLLDCCFGIPLFDSTLNKDVCDRVIKNNLCRESSLQELTIRSKDLSKKLLNFISDNQEESNVSKHSFVFPSSRNGTCIDHELPLPTKNILFLNGELSVWDGS